MKKTLLILVILNLTNIAIAQVGINHATPEATLDVVSGSNNNLAAVEGILVPRVNKGKAFNMNTSALVESTLIYVNSLSGYSGTDQKVADITTKGFYHWNGTKWVSHDGGEGEWKKDASNPLIYARRAKTAGHNIIATEDGEFGIGTINPGSLLDVRGGINIGRHNIPSTINDEKLIDLLYSGNTPSKTLYGIQSHVKANSTTNLRGGNFILDINSGASISQAKGLISQIYQSANSEVTTSIEGVSSLIRTLDDTKNRSLTGVSSTVQVTKGSDVSNNLRVGAFNFYDNGGGSAKKLTIVDVQGLLNEDTNIALYKGIEINLSKQNAYSGNGVRDAFGLYINDVDFASRKNYAIYTVAGEVSFGDDVKLRNNKSVTAYSFISTQGSTFPDYVFETYYDGKSTLNPAYNFKSLAEIESYIIENGHLPGYQSAKEIKNEGQFDMTTTQFTNVEKIEELYLHTIEQEEKLNKLSFRIDEQAAEIEELKAMVKELIRNK